MSRNLLTQEGYNSLFEKLRSMKTSDRKSIAKEIEIAREHGDISENAEYTYAKEKQALLEAKISKIESYLGNSEIITKDMTNRDGRIVFGSWAHLLNQDTDEKRVYRIVGETESDIKGGKISYKTPFAREIIGRKAGDEIEFVTPKGEEQYWEVVSVTYE